VFSPVYSAYPQQQEKGGSNMIGTMTNKEIESPTQRMYERLSYFQ